MTLLKDTEEWLLRLKIYAQTCIHIHIHMYTHACVYPYIYTCRYTHICMFKNTHTTHICEHTYYMYICTHVGPPQGKGSQPPHSQKPLEAPRDRTEDEDFLSMIKKHPEVGAVRIHMDPESLDTSFGGLTASTFQGVATLITLAGPFKMEGARWHLLSEVFSSSENIKTDLYRERLLQETMDKDPNCRSFAWKVLRQAKLAVGATTYIGDTALTAPPFFDNIVRGNSTIWGFETLGPRVINWTGLSCKDQAIILPALQSTNNWIVLALVGRPKRGAILHPVNGSVIAMTTKGKSFRKKQWWLTGEDELAAYDRKVEVLTSSRHSIPKNLLDDLEAMLNSSSAQDAPHNGTDGVEGICWEGTEAGLMGIPLFPGLIYTMDGSQEKGNMGASTDMKVKREASAKGAETKRAHPPT
jgi:hypothetical protein